MSKEELDTMAIIDIGSYAIKMKIVEIDNKGNLKEIDNLRRAASIGSDTFAIGKVSFKKVDEICNVLRNYKDVMDEYGVNIYKAVATSAIREADNREYIIDQIKINTGLDIEIISSSEEKYYTYKGIREKNNNFRKFRTEGSLIVDIGAGGTEIAMYNNNKLAFSQNISIGSLRIRELLWELERETLDFSHIIEEFVEGNIDSLRIFKPRIKLNYFVAIGGEISVISRICNDTKEKSKLNYISKKDFLEVYKKVMYTPVHILAREYNIQETRAELLLPSMIIFKKFLDMTKSDGIYAPLVSLRDGIIVDYIDKNYDVKKHIRFSKDIISAATYLAKRYKADLNHARDVKRKSEIIFDSMKDIHGLGERERFLLKISAILHDIGKFINIVNHYTNSYKIIMSSDIIGISKKEMEIIANIAGYHSVVTPNMSHKNYRALNEKDRVKTSKLIAIIRIADSLDRSHKQKIKISNITLEDKVLTIEAKIKEEASLEEWTFKRKSEFFKEVFGINTVIKLKRRL